MRAKMEVTGVVERTSDQGKICEVVDMRAVCKTGSYGPDGTDEDNTFSRWTPTGSLSLTITNPVIWGEFKVGQKFYLDFSEATQ